MKHLKTLITLFLLVIGASVSLVHGAEPQVPKRIAIWDWKSGKPSGIIGETKFEGTSGQIHSANLILDVNASGGSFTVVGSGQVKYARLTNDCTVRVPVRRAGDSVYVECQTKYNCNYTIGDAGKTVKEKLYKYLATTADAAKGYVEIKAIGDVHFYTITAVQNGFNSVLPVIELNCKGWASFTSLIPGYVLKLQDKAQAYVATSVDPAEGDFGSVTLTEVTTFGYGQGVFVHGTNFDEVLANVVEEPSTYPTDNEFTVGCTENVVLTDESHAYVIATKGDHEEAGFYYVNSDVTVPAGKTYLFIPVEIESKMRRAKGLKITFADGSEATGVESLFSGAEAETPAVLYNLSGQKVGKDYKGIVIGSDGKKYVK